MVSEEIILEHNTNDLEETLANMSSSLAEAAIKMVQEGASKCSTPRSSVFSGANSINSVGNKLNIQVTDLAALASLAEMCNGLELWLCLFPLEPHKHHATSLAAARTCATVRLDLARTDPQKRHAQQNAVYTLQ